MIILETLENRNDPRPMTKVIVENGIIKVDDKPFLFNDEEHQSKQEFILNIYQCHHATISIIEGVLQLLFAEKFSFFVGKKMSFKEIVEAIEIGEL